MGLFSGASAGIKLDADSTGYRREVKRAQRETKAAFGQMKRDAAGIGNVMKTAGRATAAGLAVIGVAAVGAGAKMVSMASDAAEVDSKLGVVFGRGVPRVTRQLEAFAKATGASSYQLREQAADMGALLGPMNLGAKQTEKMSVSITKLATDLSSMNNVPVDDALQSLRSGLTGETEPLKKFGILINAAAIETEAYTSGIAKQGSELTEQQKVQARYNLIMQKTRQAQGDATRTADGQANAQRGLANAIRDAATGFGAKLLPAVNQITLGLRNFVQSEQFRAWLDDAGTRVAAFATKIAAYVQSDRFRSHVATAADVARRFGQGVAFAAGKVASIIGFLVRHRNVVIPLTAAIVSAVAAYRAFMIIATIVKFVRALTAGQIALNVAMIANPVGLVVAAIVGLGVALVVAYKKSDRFRAIVQTVWSWVKKAAAAAWELGQKLPIVMIGKAIAKSDTFRDAIKGAWSWVKKLGSAVAGGLMQGLDMLSSAMGKLKKKLEPVADFLAKIGKYLGKIGDAAGGAASAIGGAFGDNWDFGVGIGSDSLPKGVKPQLGPFAAIARGNGLVVTSGLRAGAVTADGNRSDHSTGNAIDVSGPASKMRRVATLANMLPGVKQVIYSPLGLANRGGPFVKMKPGTKTERGHYDHVHIAAMQAGGRVPGGAHLLGDRVPAVLEPGEFVLNRKAVAGFEAHLGSLDTWNRMARGGRARRPAGRAPARPAPRRVTPAQQITRLVGAAAQRATVAATPSLGLAQAQRQLAAQVAAERALEKRIAAEKRAIAQLEASRKNTKKGSAAQKKIDAQLEKRKKTLSTLTTKEREAVQAQTGLADSVVDLRAQLEADRQQAAADAEQARRDEAERREAEAAAVQEAARNAASSATTLGEAMANLALARAEATATLDDDVAVTRQQLALAQQRAAIIEQQLTRGDLTAETQVDLINQLADATRQQKTLSDRVTELTTTTQDATDTTSTANGLTQEAMQQLVASNDAFLAGLRDVLRNERSNVTINPTFTAAVGPNQFIETMRYKLTQLGAGGAL